MRAAPQDFRNTVGDGGVERSRFGAEESFTGRGGREKGESDLLPSP